MPDNENRRSYGSGSLYEYRGAWYGHWRVGGRQVKRKLGLKRVPGGREGLTRKQAEHRLRQMIGEVSYVAPAERTTIEEAGSSYIHHLEHVMRRKPSTIQDYRCILNAHLIPFFRSRSIERIGAEDFAGYMRAKSSLSPKTVSNHLNFAHGIFAFAVKRGWAPANPVALVDRPSMSGVDPDIRFLDVDELEALLRAIPEDDLGGLERVLYLTAAMVGLRQGELVALRWRDVDWTVSQIRVRRSITRGKLGTPKTKRSSRAVPMPDRVAAELDRLSKRSAFQADDDLAFCHPHTGAPYDASKLLKRFKAARDRAGLRDDVRFHDLRHTFGTRMAAAGAPLRFIQEWMGHCNIATTEIYADYAPDATQGVKFAESAFRTGSYDEAEERGFSSKTDG